MIWNAEQNHILQVIKRGDSIFFSGPAGSGKSHLLKKVIQILTSKYGSNNQVAVLSSTGISAVNIGGNTIHSYLRIGTGEEAIENLILRNRKNKNWLAQAVIIDEISMVDGILFDKLEEMARKLRGNSKPFGGMQLILCGDFYQLPPVNTSAKYCFQSSSWSKCISQSLILQKIYRQKSVYFVNILDEVRNGIVSKATLKLLSNKSEVIFDMSDKIEPTQLFSRNANVDRINNQKLDELKGNEVVFVGKTTGTKEKANKLVENSRVPFNLKLKINAQVMLLKNIDTINGFVNGLKGIVTSFDPDSGLPLVKWENQIIPSIVTTFEMSQTDPETKKIISTYTQIPISLSWACTIHKSQGSTINKLIVDCEGIFSTGQLYVALSRAKEWDNLKIINFSPHHVKTDVEVINFYNSLTNEQSSMELIKDMYTDGDYEQNRGNEATKFGYNAKEKILQHFKIYCPPRPKRMKLDHINK